MTQNIKNAQFQNNAFSAIVKIQDMCVCVYVFEIIQENVYWIRHLIEMINYGYEVFITNRHELNEVFKDVEVDLSFLFFNTPKKYIAILLASLR